MKKLLIALTVAVIGITASAAYREAAMDAYEQRLKEFTDPKTPFVLD